MATLEELQAQRQKLNETIKKNGGKANQPNRAKQLADLDKQISGMKKEGGGASLLAPPPTKDDKFAGLTGDQNQLINQQETGDVGLGWQANQMLPQIQQNFGQQFDWNALGQAPQGVDWSQVQGMPTTGDYNNWRQQQIDATMNDFDSRTKDYFRQQMGDLEQEAYNKGWTTDTKAYQDKLKAMQQTQQDARTQNLAQAMSQAGTNATQFANIGFQGNQQSMNNAMNMYDANNQAWQNNLQRQMQQRYMPLNEYNQLRAAQSGMGMANLGYSQQMGLQQQKYQNDLGLIKATPRGGGGGGGGGGNGAIWQQYGFSSPMEYDAYKTAQNRANQMWQWQNQPGNSGPSYSQSLLGQGLGTLGTLGALYAFS